MANFWPQALRHRKYRTALGALLIFCLIAFLFLGPPTFGPSTQNRIDVAPEACTTPVTPNNDILPFAACHINKKTWAPQSFVYGFGGQNVLYPAGERFSSIEHPVMRVEYPKNSINPLSGRVGGVGWFTHDDTPNEELYLQYDVMFEKGFQWVKGGKLPGIYGGRTECSGGSTALDCFSIRLMWRKDGDGEAYLYVPKSEQDDSISTIPPKTEINQKYGISAGRGAFKFTDGQWDTVGMYVKVNDIGQRNGVFKIWINKKLVIQFDKVVWRTKDITIDGVQFETFFGGSRPGFEATEQSFTYFRNVFYDRTPPSFLL